MTSDADPRRLRGAILISGRGSNMTALLEAATDSTFPVQFDLVISNIPAAPGLDTAARLGCPTEVVDQEAHETRSSFEQALGSHLRAHGIELICLAGFMRLLSADFVKKWHDQILNIHPSLLPELKGLNTHKRALAAGATRHGCTVHLVRPAMDDGPILLQAEVPVHKTDNAATLAARVLIQEHEIYPKAVRQYAVKRLNSSQSDPNTETEQRP